MNTQLSLQQYKETEKRVPESFKRLRGITSIAEADMVADSRYGIYNESMKRIII